MPQYQRYLLNPPKSVVSNGQFNFGCYTAPFKEVNLHEAIRPYALPLPNFAQNIQLREWQAFQAGNGDYFIMMAIYNAKKLALVQFILYDIKTQKKLHYEKQVPAWQLQVPNGLYDTHAGYKSNNFKIHAHSDIGNGRITIFVEINNFKKLPPIKAHFVGYHEHQSGKANPMVVCMPFTPTRGMYSHKCLMPMKGNVQVGQQQIPFLRSNSQLIIDDHKGYYPFPTRYDWVTGFGYNKQGQSIGFNLTHNQVQNPEIYNENCLWLNGELHPLPPIKVHRPNGYKGQWLVQDEYGKVNLTFDPVVHTAVDINLLLFRSKYQGPYGYYNGTIKDKNDNSIVIEKMFGMGEDFYLRV